jgi:hypothetical protein
MNVLEAPRVFINERDISGFLSLSSSGPARGADNSGWATFLRARKAAEYAGKYLTLQWQLANGRSGAGQVDDGVDKYVALIGQKYTWFPEYELEENETYEYDDDVACGFSILFETYDPAQQKYSVSLFVEYDSSITGAPELLQIGQDGKTIAVKLEVERDCISFDEEGGIKLTGNIGRFLETYGRLMLWSVLYAAKTYVEENYKENPLAGRNNFCIHDELGKIFVGMFTVEHEYDIIPGKGVVVHDEFGHIIIRQDFSNVVEHITCDVEGPIIFHDDLGHIILNQDYSKVVNHHECSDIDGSLVFHDEFGHVILVEAKTFDHTNCDIEGNVVYHDDLGHIILDEDYSIIVHQDDQDIPGNLVFHDEFGHIILEESYEEFEPVITVDHDHCVVFGDLILHDEFGHIIINEDYSL